MKAASPGRRSSEVEQISRAILAAYDRLADGADASSGFDGKRVRKVKSEAVRAEVQRRGFLDTKETGGITDASRKHYHRAKGDLLERRSSRPMASFGDRESTFYLLPPPSSTFHPIGRVERNGP